MSSKQCNPLQGFGMNYKVLEQTSKLSSTWNMARSDKLIDYQFCNRLQKLILEEERPYSLR